MENIKTIELNEEIESNFFYQSISIYLKKTQVVNRKLSCSSNVAFVKLNLMTCDGKVIKENLEKIPENTLDSVKDTLTTLGIEFTEEPLDVLKDFHGDRGIYLSIDRFLPRNSQKFSNCFVATVIDTSTTSATFLTLNLTDNAALPPTMPSTTFKFTFSKESRELSLFVDGSTTDSNWLTFVLFKKIQSWMESCVTKNDQLQIESHSLISSELYNEVYAELKEKYGKKLEESWEESTDPKKFIYEDIAIASYLISLWKNDRKGDNLQSFCDLGCGNGLLVFILSQEGHRGYGIDLRKRKIWDKFPAETDLRENAIVPSDQSLFTDVDWIIGNHSDELSPWISILAARSSFRSKYFLLPCCAFEFSGEKYQRKSGAKSQYLSYIDYLMEISNVCGFADTKLDRLKIPSTKRICLIGTQRNYKEENFQHQCEKIQNFINATNSQQTKGSSEKWSTSFTPREKLEAVKNCTKIDKMLSDSIVKRIFEKVLSLETLSDGWSSGGILPLPEAVKLVSQDELKQLKSECGGLQTLLKNKHQIFHIYNGSIQIRAPKKLSENLISARSMKRNVVKTVPCYFFLNHPNSCPILDDDCCYIH